MTTWLDKMDVRRVRLYDLLFECRNLMKRVSSRGVRLNLQNPWTRNQSYYRRRKRRKKLWSSSQSADEASFTQNSDESLVSNHRNETEQTVVHEDYPISIITSVPYSDIVFWRQGSVIYSRIQEYILGRGSSLVPNYLACFRYIWSIQ